MKAFLLRLWRLIARPSVHFSLGFLTLGGFVAGVMFWGGFNTALEATNTESFCISCHEMRDNVYEELKSTPHWANTSARAFRAAASIQPSPKRNAPARPWAIRCLPSFARSCHTQR